MEFVLKQFKESHSENAPTEQDKNMAKLIISNIRNIYPDSSRVLALQTMFDCTYKWKDLEMWRDLVERFGRDVGVRGEHGLIRAFCVFGFDQTRPGCVIRL
jgi:hypothetical protein